MKEIPWNELKSFVDQRKLSIQWIELNNTYYMWAYDGPMHFTSAIYKNGTDEIEFETSYKDLGNKSPKSQVVTQFELDNKSLRTFWAHGVTDSQGKVSFAVKVPQPARYVAFGDAEFEEREFLDQVSSIYVEDRDRLVGWQIALSINPSATEPVPDAVVQQNGFPLYPVLGHYDERVDLSSSNSSGTILKGMSMTFQYGSTEAQPVGGYAYIPGGFYFVIECQKETATPGKRCKISVDWAEPETESDL